MHPLGCGLNQGQNHTRKHFVTTSNTANDLLLQSITL